MPERDPLMPPDRSSATGAWQPPPVTPVDGSGQLNDSPTVRTGSTGSVLPDGGGSSQASNRNLPRTLPNPGDRLDGFLLHEAIGVGGMGAVFRAQDDQLDRMVALKILPPELAKDPEAVQRFYQEGRAAARLDHENIARVFTIGHASDTHYIAFEFIDGSTLRQRVEQGGVFSVGDAINYTLQIAAALVHADERGVVHRDVKPSNIIVTSLGRAKLVDMGLARSFERGGDTGITQTGMTLGTFDYISPEQARDPRSVDVRSDLYSLGCTLFYMLAGRPPFPDGTVLQKLLQHQEELPPDIRSLNASVPVDLAAILVKLMAKDRNRRYQSPEQLVRDLLLVAGSLNLRSISPEGLVWMDAAAPPIWERHLVWGVPTLAFAVILFYLIWSSQQGDSTSLVSFPPEVVGPIQKVGKATSLPQTLSPTNKPEPTTSSKVSIPSRATPHDVVVRKSDDLSRIIAESAPGTTLLLNDDGPYDLRPGPTPLTPHDLILRAGIGLQPVIRLAADSLAAKTTPALLDLKDGRLTIDGIEFQVDSDDRDLPLAAIRTVDTDLTMIHCLVRRVGTKPGRGQTTGLFIRESSPDSVWKGPAEIVVDASHLDGGQFAIQADGPVDLTIRDATVGMARIASIACSNQDSSKHVAVLRLSHVSLLAGEGPVLQCSGVSPRLQVNDCVIAPAGDRVATLVTATDPARLEWRGRDNLYSWIAIFLQADPSSTTPFNTIRSFDTWADEPTSVREAGSVLATKRVWAEEDPSVGLTSRLNNPSLAFRLSQVDSSGNRVGARRGPFGAIDPPLKLATTQSAPDPAKLVKPLEPLPQTKLEPILKPTAPDLEPLLTDIPAAMPPMRMPDDDAPNEMPPPKDIDTVEVKSPIPPKSGTDTLVQEPPVRPAQVETVGPTKRVDEPAGLAQHQTSKLIRTAEQLTTALAQVGGRGETLRLASNADLELSSLQLRATGSWVIEGESGKPRPKIRFRPKVGEKKPSDSWLVWLNLVAGSLRLERIDFVLAKGDAPQSGRWGLFALAPGTNLNVNDCTVTIEGSVTRSAVIVVPPGREANGFELPDPEPLTATVRLKDSLFRSGGDLVDVAAGRRLDLEVDNVLVTTRGALLHGHGRTQGVAAEPLKLTLRRLTARNEGGLVQLESTVNETELPQAEVVARDSVLSTNGKGAPLIQVDGQDDPESLRDRIRWDGSGVAYHQISNYRRDQILKPGELPTSFDRSSWELAVGRRESNPHHGGAMFINEWPPERQLWTARPTDFQLKPDSTPLKTGSGTDLSLIPEPPA